MRNRRRSQAGITLIELLIAVTLFGAISASMGLVLNIAFTSMNKIDDKVDFNRRIIASQRTIDQVILGMIPLNVPCAGRPIGFVGRQEGVRFLSSYSLGEGARGRPRIVELFADSSPNGGFRLLLNEQPYLGKTSLTMACAQPFQRMESSFILADRLTECRFSFRRREPGTTFEGWFGVWAFPDWPTGVRIDMAPTVRQQSQIQPTTVFAPIFVLNNNIDATIF